MAPLISYRKTEKGQCSGEAAIVICVIAIVILGIWLTISNNNKINDFDASFASGEIKIQGAVLAMGESGNPIFTDYQDYIPSASSVSDSPRYIDVNGRCVSLYMPHDASRIRIATTFVDPSKISVQMPPHPTGTVNICVPDQSMMRVYFWSETAE